VNGATLGSVPKYRVRLDLRILVGLALASAPSCQSGCCLLDHAIITLFLSTTRFRSLSFAHSLTVLLISTHQPGGALTIRKTLHATAATMSDTEGDTTMMDEDAVREENAMYGSQKMTRQELDEKFPNRPHNLKKTLPFSDLYLTLFNPLKDNKKKPGVAAVNKRKTGPDDKSFSEIRRTIIERFIARWRNNVGNDIFPAFRLMMPEKDRDRAMYGLKEMTIGKLLVKLMKIDKNSDDGYNILHWKLPGIKSSAALAGDFAGRCHEVIRKRPMRTTPGNMTIAEVNEKLDELSGVTKEEDQLPIFQHFYNNMNAEELMWLIRIIQRQMKIGATEKTVLEIWHPDADNLFNISSSLKRVCWELYDPQVRL
jgi:DNA ligase-4